MNAFKKWWVKLLLVIAVTIMVFAVWLSISGVHGKSAVERYKEQLRAAGEKLELNELVPSRIDPEKNGLELYLQAFNSMGPMSGMLSSNPPPGMRMVAPGKAEVGWRQTEIVGGYPTFCTNTWEDLEKELQRGSAGIDFVRQAADRPQLDFELDYSHEAISMGHLSKMKQVSLLLSAAALADLHRGDAASATTNLHTLLVLVNQWKDEPIFISQIVRIAIANTAFSMQWEFLQGANITDQQLALLQRDWTNSQFVQPMENALSMGRIREMHLVELLRTSNSPSGAFSGYLGSAPSGGGGSGDWLDTLRDARDAMKRRTSDTLWRVSWSYDDELTALQGHQVLLETGRQVRTNGYFKDALADRDRKLAVLGLNGPRANWLRSQLDDVLTSFLGVESVQSAAQSWERVLNIEAARIITITAIAVKRFQLRHGTAPPDLNALVPEFLPAVPRDPVDGKPLRYQLNADGTFLLYSIGSNGIDDGGDPNPPAGAKSLQWQRCKDWVWPQAAP